MQYDLGLPGLGLLVVISLGFGVVVQIIGTAGSRWEWLVAAGGWLIGGLIASEIVWGAATVSELQPIIDGLAFDESLLGGIVVGIPVAILTRFVTGGGPSHRPMSA